MRVKRDKQPKNKQVAWLKLNMRVLPNGNIFTPGVNYDSKHVLLSMNSDFIMTKTSSGTHFASRGTREYHSPEIRVFKILKIVDAENKSFFVEEIISHELCRGAQK